MSTIALPTISQYINAVGNPKGLFRTLEIVAERDIYNRPKHWVGNSAVVFKVRVGGELFALRCFLKQNSRVESIYTYLSENPSPLVAGIKYYSGELYVFNYDGSGRWVDVVLYPWAEGYTLDKEIADAIKRDDRKRLAELADMFNVLSDTLSRMEWAHGDLKPENIIVSGNGLSLIDFDAMFLPCFAGQKAYELGTPPYSNRTSDQYDGTIDDYSVEVIKRELINS